MTTVSVNQSLAEGGGCERDVEHRMNDVNKDLAALKMEK